MCFGQKAELVRYRTSRGSAVASLSGMTLVEIMVAVLIIGVLAAIAVPSAIGARNRARNTSVASTIRTFVAAFEMFGLEMGYLPDDSEVAVVPDGMDGYLRRRDWTAVTQFGGRWDWCPDIEGFGNGVGLTGIRVGDNTMNRIDHKIDDGDLATGKFRKILVATNAVYVYLVELE